MIRKNVVDIFVASRRIATWVGMGLLVAVSGCGPARAKPVNVEVAKETLIKVLDHWKHGGTIEELRRGRPEIVAQEQLWTSGNKLLDFTVANEGREEDANWYCDVELILQPSGNTEPTKKKVTYVVGTDPVLTVFHAIL